MPLVPGYFRNFLAAALAALGSLCLSAAAHGQAARPAQDPALAVVKRCRPLDFAAKRDCYSAALDERLASGGPAAALQLLDRLAALDSDALRQGHFYAHRIGISALKSPAEVGRVFAACTPAFESGCYHGVIQSYFIAAQRDGGGISTASVDALCGGYRGTRADLLFQCTHGLGHGLTILRSHDLPQALLSCDLLSREPEREMCYAGAFMESLVHAEDPGSISTADEHGSMGMGGSAQHDHHAPPVDLSAGAAPAKPFRALDPADLHYPCSRLDEKYLIACYTIQTSAMLQQNGHDVAGAAIECGRAPEKARATCFLSLGRDVSTIALKDHAEAVRLCDLAEPAFRPACHEGVVKSIVNMNANPAEGIPYCRAVAEDASKRACYVAVGLQSLGLPEGQAKREQACRLAEAGMVEACLDGPAPPAPGGDR
ncbi:MAG: hypothetical protein QOJ91_9 [Sphingomonadales bacterium]|jgi:hypothetical protein|nr:hypothetical protein [Sphingomonadales bacterium]